jgi:hypothetical protein
MLIITKLRTMYFQKLKPYMFNKILDNYIIGRKYPLILPIINLHQKISIAILVQSTRLKLENFHKGIQIQFHIYAKRKKINTRKNELKKPKLSL